MCAETDNEIASIKRLAHIETHGSAGGEKRTVEIRFAEASDVRSIMTFEPLMGERLAEIVEGRMLVAVDGTLLGYLSWMFGGCIGQDYVNKIFVKPDCRRRGIARDLLRKLDETLPRRVFISAGAQDDVALGFIRATGWTEAGEVLGLLPAGEAESFFYRDAGCTALAAAGSIAAEYLR